MSVLHDDIKVVGSFTSDRNGYKFTIEMILSDIDGDNGVAQVYNALIDSKIPLRGTDLSAIDVDLIGCWLRDFDAELMSPGTVKIILYYSHSPVEQLVIDAGSTLNQVSTNKDKNGTAVSLSYEYPDPYPLNPALAGVTVTQGGTFTKQVPERVLTYKLREQNSPQSFAHLYEGKVNNATWQSGDTGTWLCASIIGTSDNSGVDYVNRYHFQYRKDGWDPAVAYIDPMSGKPPADLVADTGIKTVLTYDSFTFTDLFPAT